MDNQRLEHIPAPSRLGADTFEVFLGHSRVVLERHRLYLHGVTYVAQRSNETGGGAELSHVIESFLKALQFDVGIERIRANLDRHVILQSPEERTRPHPRPLPSH